ncbi:Myeloid leukemia factor [Carpediemonas membranifera]|uniref:Myeloid leukemia factor n=1 Tax=Carpediemonas membranifera TaxID=201153 RepID=A0A8J6AS03_9EUKA|nr:Myeloid leukemia factor [Carpediemonas membranifera]|eukprot:KAG9390830.1 Myeloid leukemia factor [Carpediemonas membranifera]
MFGRSLFDDFDDFFPSFGHWPSRNGRRERYRRENVHIEPVSDGNNHTESSSSRPTVDEPDDHGNLHRTQEARPAPRDWRTQADNDDYYEPRQSRRQQIDQWTDPFDMLGPRDGPSLFSRMDSMLGSMFDDSVESRVGPGVSYSSTTTTTSHGGVTETRQSVRKPDGVTRTVHSRRIGERSVEVIDEDDGRGNQTQTRNVIGMADNDAARFDDDWNGVAQSLPDTRRRHSGRSSRMLEDNRRRRHW